MSNTGKTFHLSNNGVHACIIIINLTDELKMMSSIDTVTQGTRACFSAARKHYVLLLQYE